MSKATAGPWYVYRDSAENFYVGSDIVDVARIVGSDADARLIAAAPDLLWALEQIVNDLPGNRDWLDRNLEAFAKSAIAKARGDA